LGFAIFAWRVTENYTYSPFKKPDKIENLKKKQEKRELGNGSWKKIKSQGQPASWSLPKT